MAIIKTQHGTNSDFDKFDASFLGANTDDNASSEAFRQTAHLGFWFNLGGDLSIAYDKILSCEITLSNPMDVENLETLAYWIESQGESGEELRLKLMEQGYDGIVLNDEEFGGVSYVVFDADNIKIEK